MKSQFAFAMGLFVLAAIAAPSFAEARSCSPPFAAIALSTTVGLDSPHDLAYGKQRGRSDSPAAGSRVVVTRLLWPTTWHRLYRPDIALRAKDAGYPSSMSADMLAGRNLFVQFRDRGALWWVDGADLAVSPTATVQSACDPSRGR